MGKEFVNYEQAIALKELGFDEKCLMYYDYSWTLIESGVYECKAPLYQQAFRWFREKHNLFGCIDLHTSTPIHWYIRIDDIIKNDYIYHSEDNDLKFKTYEEAELECLKKLIEIVK
jgi:hypothetical protein